jgi:hypothetical protein
MVKGIDKNPETKQIYSMSKTQLVRNHIEAGNIKEALRIGSGFRVGIDRSVVKRGYECCVHPDFYRAIGKDIDTCINEGIVELKRVVYR